MQCPICVSHSLQPERLAADLLVHACGQCDGLFIFSADYLRWRELHPHNLPEQHDHAPVAAAREPACPKRCPYCGHLLLGYRVSSELPFTLDHCGACNSVWFDRDEWAALVRCGLHDDVNRMFTDAWQRRVREATRRVTMQARYAAKFGAADYAEAQRVRAWLAAHAQQQALRAYLNAEDPYRV